jgi:hypothetical protein
VSIQGLDAERCRKRNRIAARRDLMDAFPLHLSAASPLTVPESRMVTARGTLPPDASAAIDRINAMRGDDAPPLGLEDVYIHYAEAANSNYTSKYSFFLGSSTLRNFAADADRGIAFMNSHRTGGLSHPAEQPYGRTFAGRYERYHTDAGTVQERTLIGIYMLRGVKPNGDSGPSTDDFDAMIRGGTTFDVSVGIPPGGSEVCDLCGNDLSSEDCGHVPGTHRNVSPEQRTSQKARGVSDGSASYTLHDAHMSEVSSVFDGAVPGAGFRKALSLSRRNELSARDILEARAAYRMLSAQGDFNMDEIQDLAEQAAERGLTKVLRAFGFKSRTATAGAAEAEDDDAGAIDEQEEQDDMTEPKQETLTNPPAPEQEPIAASATLAVTTEETDELVQLRAENTQLKEQTRRDAATLFVDEQIRLGKLYPAERDENIALHMHLAQSGNAALLERALSARPAHGLTQERVPSDATILYNSRSPDGKTAEQSSEAVDRVLSATPEGREILKHRAAAAASKNGNGTH